MKSTKKCTYAYFSFSCNQEKPVHGFALFESFCATKHQKPVNPKAIDIQYEIVQTGSYWNMPSEAYLMDGRGNRYIAEQSRIVDWSLCDWFDLIWKIRTPQIGMPILKSDVNKVMWKLNPVLAFQACND